MDETTHLEQRAFLFVPQIDAQFGFGHLKRLLTLMKMVEEEYQIACYLYLIEKKISPSVRDFVQNKLLQDRILYKLKEDSKWSLIVCDLYKSDQELASELARHGLVVALDEGGAGRGIYPYLLDVLPKLEPAPIANEIDMGYLLLPQLERIRKAEEHDLRILISFGGSDQARLTEVVGDFLSGQDFPAKQWAVVKGPMFGRTVAWPGVKVYEDANIAQLLLEYDVIITHFGITAYEALALGVKPILLNPTEYHQLLARQEKFFSLGLHKLSKEAESWFKNLISNDDTLDALQRIPLPTRIIEKRSLAKRLVELSGFEHCCPVCHSQNIKEIHYRTKRKSYAECANCQMIYLIAFEKQQIVYDASYFDESYKEQYGRSYLDDFEHIKAMGKMRLERIESLHKGVLKERSLLDIGCAYGPFLQAGKENGWDVFGMDTAESAIHYVRGVLNIEAGIANFPKERAYQDKKFGLVTMWYVIEHFSDLDQVMNVVNAYLVKDGIFAFATPKGDGLSAKRDAFAFFEASPDDHYTIFRESGLKRFLERYGFTLMKIETTGIHVQRKFPSIKAGSIRDYWLKKIFKYRGLGDTFEIYAQKKRDLDGE